MSHRERRRWLGLLALLLAVYAGLTIVVASRPTYPERCAVHYQTDSLAWKTCIQRLRFGGSET